MSIAKTHTELCAARLELFEARRDVKSLTARRRRARAPIDRSWRRSVMTAEPTAAISYIGESPASEPLLRAALPVLEYWLPSLEGFPLGLFLADPKGRIIARRVGDLRHARRLDNASAAVGFGFSEATIGTNGLGTAIEDRTAVLVRGPEHYSDALQSLACAGVPILDRASQRVVGSLAIAAPVKSAAPMMLAVARQLARQIENEYMDSTMPPQLRTVLNLMLRKPHGRPTLVVAREGMFCSVDGLERVSPENHILLWEDLRARDWSRDRHPVSVSGKSGEATRIGDPRGVHAYVIEFDGRDPIGAFAAAPPPSAEPMSEPGVPMASEQPLTRLRDHPERIAALVREFRVARGVSFSPAAQQALLRWDWPGGVGELEALLHRLATENPKVPIQLDALPEPMHYRGISSGAIVAAEYRAIEAALRDAGGNRTRAAELLGIGRTTLWRKMRTHGIDGHLSVV